MNIIDTPISLNSNFIEGFHSKRPIQGLTHNLYQYPARFSPFFAKSIIRDFTSKGDLIIDPFMGSGTTLVESMVAGRHSLGIDLNPLANLISTVKTTIYSKNQLIAIENWWERVKHTINLSRPNISQDEFWTKNGYHKNIPWRLKKIMGLIIDSITSLNNRKQEDLVRCVLMSTSKKAFENNPEQLKVGDFILQFETVLHFSVNLCRQLSSAIKISEAPKVKIFQLDALNINAKHFKIFKGRKASIVITSPPYPGVHILYHRWQVDGSKETAAPFWIAGSEDGQGEAYYTLGGRSRSGIDNYFQQIEKIYRNLHSFLEEKALVFQMVAFSNINEQLCRFNEAMNNAGFREKNIQILTGDINVNVLSSHLTRRVPLRKWYADMKGATDSSLEFLIVHQRK